MDKNRFETQKEVVDLDPTVHNIQALFSVEDLKWLMEQAEKVVELEKEIEEHCETKGLLGRQVFALTKRVDELTEEIHKLKK